MGKSSNCEVIASSPKCVIIRDVGPWSEYMTVTNDAERVVELLVGGLGGRRLFYLDSEGELGELKIDNGRFSGFGAV